MHVCTCMPCSELNKTKLKYRNKHKYTEKMYIPNKQTLQTEASPVQCERCNRISVFYKMECAGQGVECQMAGEVQGHAHTVTVNGINKAESPC